MTEQTTVAPEQDSSHADGKSVLNGGLEAETGYMCKVDYDHELGMASDGVRIYPSLESLMEYRKCVNGDCGIVRVRVMLEEVIKDDSF